MRQSVLTKIVQSIHHNIERLKVRKVEVLAVAM